MKLSKTFRLETLPGVPMALSPERVVKKGARVSMVTVMAVLPSPVSEALAPVTLTYCVPSVPLVPQVVQFSSASPV